MNKVREGPLGKSPARWLMNSVDHMEWQCRYTIDPPSSNWRLITVEFEPVPRSSEDCSTTWSLSDDVVLFLENVEATEAIFGSAGAIRNLAECLTTTRADSQSKVHVVKLIAPKVSGRLVRSDIIQLRLWGCEWATSIATLAEPDKVLDVDVLSSLTPQLADIFKAAAALIHVREGEPGLASHEEDLTQRLSFPWYLTHQRSQSCLVIVEGGHTHPKNGGWAPLIYHSARALGLKIIVIDKPGHWLEGPEFAQWREKFIATDLPYDPDEEFVDRIIVAVRKYGDQVDGMITLCDRFKAPVALACQKLGLPTENAEAYNIATSKYRTSALAGHGCYLETSVDGALRSAAQGSFTWPIVVKPCIGWSSEGVSRVNNIEALTAAVQAISTDRHGEEFIMEPYCDGPEVDVNIVMMDGEMVFHEISDDFPKPAEITAAISSSFLELDCVLPSILPETELALLAEKCREMLLLMGFRNGVFHTEWRVQNSSCEYQSTEGKVELQARVNIAEGQQPCAWLHEVNP